MNNPCLVVIDVQERLFPVMHQKENLLKNLEILIKGFKLFDLPIFVTEQVPEKLGPTIDPIGSLLNGIEPISKTSFSCAAAQENDVFDIGSIPLRREPIGSIVGPSFSGTCSVTKIGKSNNLNPLMSISRFFKRFSF